ncbi:MAG: hypothetical protein KME49_25715 [Brasilonema octagenarum HA4186-MV1]|nr:hypothetical protein [Brasilonema octagenarum HA4186-MV1]
MEQVRDRLLAELKSKRQLGTQSQEFKSAKRVLDQFIDDTKELRPTKSQPIGTNAEVLAFLVKLREVSSEKGRLTGECRILVDHMIFSLGGEGK